MASARQWSTTRRAEETRPCPLPPRCPRPRLPQAPPPSPRRCPPPRPSLRNARALSRCSALARALCNALAPALGSALASLLASSPALAAETAQRTAPLPAAVTARIVEVRVALSTPAARRFAEPRLRRLLEIELQDSAVLAPGVSGPLGDDVAYVWIDEPSAAEALIEVRLGDRPVAHRAIGTAGLSGDVAARLVAIAASEMVRAELEPVAKAPTPATAPRKPTPAELEKAARALPAAVLEPGVAAAFLPASGSALAGPSLAAGFRFLGLGETLTARWLTGAGDAGSLRILELGLGVEHRLWLGRSFRLALGGDAAIASVRLGAVDRLTGTFGDHDTWTARAGGVIGGEVRLSPAFWLGLQIEPGAILRPISYERGGATGSLGGLWMGVGLALHVDLLPGPELLPALGDSRPP